MAHLQRDVAAFEDCLAGDLTAPVRSCPGWDVAELATHLGRVHRWAGAALMSTDEPRYPSRPDTADLRAWFAEGAADLLIQLGRRDPGQPCWSFWQPQTVAFWVRRQAHETAVHRRDAEGAVGSPGSIDRDLARDGVAEVVEVMYPRQLALGRSQPLDVALILRDGDRQWTLGAAGRRVVLAAGAEDLLLLLWKRRTLDEVLAEGGQLDGERALAESVLAGNLTP